MQAADAVAMVADVGGDLSSSDEQAAAVSDEGCCGSPPVDNAAGVALGRNQTESRRRALEEVEKQGLRKQVDAFVCLMLKHYPSGAADGDREGGLATGARPWRNYVALSKQWACEGHDCLLPEIEGLNLLMRDSPICRLERSSRDQPDLEPGIRVNGSPGLSGGNSGLNLSVNDNDAEDGHPSVVAGALSSSDIAPVVASASSHVHDAKADRSLVAEAGCIKGCTDSGGGTVPDECEKEAVSPAPTLDFGRHLKRPREDDSDVVTLQPKHGGASRAAAAEVEGSPSQGYVMIDLTKDD